MYIHLLYRIYVILWSIFVSNSSKVIEYGLTVTWLIDQHPYVSVFYDSTIEVIELGGFLSRETVFLIIVGIGLLALLGIWVYDPIHHISKKTKKELKIEVGTGLSEANMDEWLEEHGRPPYATIV